MSGSSSKTSTSSSQSTNVSELNLQDTGGITVADNSGPTHLTYVSTDDGAVSSSISGIVQAVKAALSSNASATSDVTSASVTLGTDALDSGTQVANHGLDNAAAAYASGLSFGTNALNTVANLISDSELRNESLTSAALSGYQSIAQQNSASNSTQLQKVAIYALVAAVAIVVLPKAFQ